MRRFLMICLCAAASLVACGDEDETASSAPVTMEEYWSQLEVIGCKKSFSCCGATSDDLNIAKNWRKGAASADACKAQGLFDDERDVRLAMVKRSTLIFHGDAARRCLDDWDKTSCENFYNNRSDHTPASCEEAFEGRGKVGDSCELSDECEGNLGCIGSINSGYRCQKIPAVGESCSGYCPYGSYCGPAGTCTPSKPQGASCSYTSTFECQGLCDYQTKICGPPLVFTPACDG